MLIAIEYSFFDCRIGYRNGGGLISSSCLDPASDVGSPQGDANVDKYSCVEVSDNFSCYEVVKIVKCVCWLVILHGISYLG